MAANLPPSRFRRNVVKLESAVDRIGEAWRSATGSRTNGTISPHAGYVYGTQARVLARAMEEAPAWTPVETDSRWANFRAVGRLFRTAEISHALVELNGSDVPVTVRADDEGYIDAEVPVRACERMAWSAVEARLPEVPQSEPVEMPVLCVGPDANFAVVSDIDDTVMRTGAENLARNIWTTFTGNALTRDVYEHVPKLYQALTHDGGTWRNPVFYLSSSPWNLYSLIYDVLQHNDVPWGPIFLRDYGIDETKFLTGTHGGHKKTNALRLMDDLDGLPFLFVGDLGQKDAEIYAAVARERPGRVLGAILHQPSDSSHDDKRRHVQEMEDAGIPTLVTPDYAEAFEFCRRRNWIDDMAEENVSASARP